MSTGRLKEISNELIDLCADLQRISGRALPLVEEIENDFDEALLPREVYERFRTMQRLITKVVGCDPCL
jgi:hypothetical protein